MAGEPPVRGIPPVAEPVEVVRRAVAGTPVLRRVPLCPLMHGAAAWTAWQSLLGGGAVIIDSDVHLDPAAALRLAEAAEADLVMVVGDAVARPLADALGAARAVDPAALPLPRLQLIASGGAILSPAVKDQLRALLPEVGILDSFGSSETGQPGPPPARARRWASPPRRRRRRHHRARHLGRGRRPDAGARRRHDRGEALPAGPCAPRLLGRRRAHRSAPSR